MRLSRFHGKLNMKTSVLDSVRHVSGKSMYHCPVEVRGLFTLQSIHVILVVSSGKEKKFWV
jgi:hypothetical protein